MPRCAFRPPAALVAALSVLVLGVPVALAHEGNPNFESLVRSTSPQVEGLRVEVLNRDDALQVTNRTGKDVVIMGYEDDPYVRLRADGTVQFNQMSTATYLNEDRFKQTGVPDGVDGDKAPEWKTIDKTGRVDFHDHRMHWMSEGTIPPAVKDEAQRTKVFNWKVPIAVAGQPGAITGELFWTPTDGGGTPTGAIIAAAIVLLGGVALVVVVRRRRSAGGGGPADGARSEAW